MRAKRWIFLSLLAGTVLIDPTALWAQRGGGGGGPGGGGYGGGGQGNFGGGGQGGFGGGGGGGGRQAPDPEAMWQRISGGSDTLDLNKNPNLRFMLGNAPIPPDGIVTKAMFQSAMAQRAAQGGGFGRGQGGPGMTPPISPTPVPGTGAPMVISVGSGSGAGDKPIIVGVPGSTSPGIGGPGMQPGMGGPGGQWGGQGMGGPGGQWGGPGMGGPGGPGGGGRGGPGGRGGNMWGDPDNLFRMADKNGDGKITKDETQMLLPFFDQIDTNKDGAIDLNELKAYAATQGAGPGNFPGSGELPRNQELEEERPIVYRFGKLPKDFPYANLDKDEDGQISLYEWRTANKSVDEFLDRDLNGDGFLTAEEWLRGTKTSLGGGETKGRDGRGNGGGGPGGPGGGFGTPTASMGNGGGGGGGRGGPNGGGRGPGGGSDWNRDEKAPKGGKGGRPSKDQ